MKKIYNSTTKIYNSITMDMNDGFKVLEEDSFIYTGPMALCDDGEPGDGEENNDDKDDESNQGINSNDFKDMMTGFTTTITGGFQQLGEQISGMGTQQQQQTPDEEDDSSNNIPDDLESLSRKDLLGVIANVLDNTIDKKLKTVTRRLDTDQDTRLRENAENQIKQAISNHKDFHDWKPELGVILKQKPHLNIEDALTLVRSADSKKATELDKKYQEKKDDNDEDSIDPKKPFGGIRPEHGSKGTKKGMKLKDASEEAFKAIFGDVKDVTGNE